MKKYFLDTSALFKRYQVEKGTTKIDEIFSDKKSQIFISNLTIIEIISNLKRLSEVDKVTTQFQFYLQRNQFYKDIQEYKITILDLTSENIIEAEKLLLKQYMKPVDSIQLAIALSLPVHNLIFVCSDQLLCKIAEKEGLKTLNLEDYPAQ